ncbi:MAG: pilus assembly protein PilM, partial [Verrucomicrobia bacterium]|nr:pilus assembly protein PilM [Verrucomicrobiota bacterium]
EIPCGCPRGSWSFLRGKTLAQLIPALSREEDIVGIDIADGSVSAIRFSFDNPGEPELTHVGWAEFDTHATEVQIAGSIKKLWHRCKLPSRTVCSCLRTRSLTLKPFTFPHLAPEEMESALTLEAEEVLQIPPKDIYLDWHVCYTPGQSEARGAKGFLVAVPRRDIERHLSILKMAGLYPVIVDVGAASVSNLFLRMCRLPENGDAVCITNLSRRNVDIIILAKDGCPYPRSIFSRSVDWEEATDYLIESVRDALKYYVYKLRGNAVTELVFTGRIPSQDLFLEKVHGKLSLPARAWNPYADWARKSEAAIEHLADGDIMSGVMTSSMGLALRRE